MQGTVMPFHDEQLRWILWIAEHLRSPFLDPFFRFLNYFDTKYFFFFLFPVLWYGVSYKWGLRFYYLALCNSLLNGFFKRLVAWPRPSQEMSGLGMFDFPTNGFPSGAAQSAMLFACLLIYYRRKRSAWVIGIPYLLLISFSRIYLGVHYPIDILGGWLFGLAIFLLFINLVDPLENLLKKIGLFPSFLISMALPILIFFFHHQGKAYAAGIFAVGIGAYLTYKHRLYEEPTNFKTRIFQSLFGIAGIFAIYWIWPKELSPRLEFFILFLWLSLAVGPICKFLKIRQN